MKYYSVWTLCFGPWILRTRYQTDMQSPGPGSKIDKDPAQILRGLSFQQG